MKTAHKTILSAFGVGALVIGTSSSAWAFDTDVIDWAIGELCGHISGNLGGLLVTVAGFGAIVAAAMGSYRVFYGAIITAVGAFAVSTIMSLYFPQASRICSNGGGQAAAGGAGGGANARVLGDAATGDPFDALADKY